MAKVKGIEFSSRKEAKEYEQRLLNEGFFEAMMIPIGRGRYVVVKDPSSAMKKAEFEELPGMARKIVEEEKEIEDKPSRARTAGERVGQAVMSDVRESTPVAGQTVKGIGQRAIQPFTEVKQPSSKGPAIKSVPESRLKLDMSEPAIKKIPTDSRIKAKPSTGKLRP